MRYAIYPPIGLARVGNHPTGYFIGPEMPQHPGMEPNGEGSEAPVKEYKVDEDEIKRQAARFRLFAIPEAKGAPEPAILPAGATIEWTVHLVNKKGAVHRGGGPPLEPERPRLEPDSGSRLIDPLPRTISGPNAGGVRFDTGEFLGRRVPLGELRTDQDQRLVVLGGFGFSSSPTNAGLPSFYTNPGWHDDVADGPVTARIRLADGSTIDDVAPAWVLVGPPDFAPEIPGVVTIYDIMLELGVRHLGVPPPAPVSFTEHVFPLLRRTRALQWVNEDPNWESISDDWPALADPSPARQALRRENARLVLEIESILSRYRLTSVQRTLLEQWVAGKFSADWRGMPQPGGEVTAAGLTRAALDGIVGQGFFPGIEGGIVLRDHLIYGKPFDFRLDHTQLSAGDVTALMAVPWQADFADCSGGWWPSQRPDSVLPDAAASVRVDWARGAKSHGGMVNNYNRLGFVTAALDQQGNVVFVETQRAPEVHFL
jgi:hypothetical protein